MQRTNTRLPESDYSILLTAVADEVIGYGPIGPYLRDPTVSEVMVNGWNQIYIERKGKLIETETHYKDDGAVLRAIDNIVLPLGRKIDRSQPLVDARLPDGSRVNADYTAMRAERPDHHHPQVSGQAPDGGRPHWFWQPDARRPPSF